MSKIKDKRKEMDKKFGERGNCLSGTFVKSSQNTKGVVEKGFSEGGLFHIIQSSKKQFFRYRI